MLNRNSMRPAFAAAGAQGFAKADRSEANRYTAFSQAQSEADDFNAFGSSQEKQKAAPKQSQPNKQRPQRPQKGNTQIPLQAILIACASVLAIILLIVIAVAIFSAPKKEIRLKDNAYFTYTDSEGKGYVVSNGEVIKYVFDGEVSIVPAKDYSFAYIFERITTEEVSGVKMYILEGKNLKDIQALADDIPTILADFEPGIIYEQNSRYHYYSSDDHAPITANPTADNFVISNDATVVVYTEESKKEAGHTELKYFKNGGSRVVGPYNFKPVGLSNDGKYVFGTSASGNLYYLEVTKKADKTTEAKQISSAKNGIFKSITGVNITGKEIVFCTDSSKGVTSFLYTIGKDEPTEIAAGLFTPVSADRQVVCQSTFVNSYFICAQSTFNEEGDTASSLSTYFFDKSEGARKLADTIGQFSPDKKYFYYIDENNNLVRIPLRSKDFVKSEEPILNSVSDFAVVEKGDVYVMLPDVDKGFIYFWDSSTKTNDRITYEADIDSMQFCGNSIYFSETTGEGTTVYVSTNGSAKEVATFKSGNPTVMPTIEMGAIQTAYAYFTDENGNTKLYYTSNGKKFSLVANSCTILDTEQGTESKDTDSKEEESEEEADEE